MIEAIYEYEKAKRVYDLATRVMECSAPWSEKYDMIFSSAISDKLTFQYCDPDADYEDDVRAWYAGATEHIEKLKLMAKIFQS